jgi:hypothetical protein
MMAQPIHGPIPRSPRSWLVGLAAAVGFWTVFIATAMAYQFSFHGQSYPISMLPFDALLVGMAALCSLALALAIRRLTGFPFGAQVGLTAVLVAAAAPPFEFAFRHVYYVLGAGPSIGEVGVGAVAANSLFWLAPFGMWATGVLALLHHAEARRRERQTAEAQLQAHHAQVRALRYQINPHFLYNTLNSVSALILDGRSAEADAMVVKLAAFFRASLSLDPLEDVPLGEEVAHQLLYLGIERVRFADRLQVSIDVPPELEKAGVPSFILQPLVENAMKHGMRGRGRRLHLRIGARACAGMLTIEVDDDGAGCSGTSGTGTGLSNVERRLRSRHGERANVAAERRSDGFAVRLNLPLTVLP